jgi:Tfp pilus assembly protein PilX
VKNRDLKFGRVHASLNQQRGATTLLISVVLFLVAMLVMLYVNRGAVAEQRMSANEVRAKEAFAQATAGLDQALAYMRNGGIDQNKDNAADPINGGRYRAIYCGTNVEPPACPAAIGAPACGAPPNFTDVLVLSCGWSDDNTAVQRVVQHLRGSASTAGNASTPLVSKSTTDLLTGGASIFNFFNDLTIWSGGPTLGQSATGKTFIRDTFNGTANDDFRVASNSSPACNNPAPGYTCSTQGSTIGHDVVTGDTSLSSATPAEYFERFFGKTPTDYQATVPTMTVAPGDVGTLDGARNEVIWVTGDATLNGTIGTADHPVIVIVDGALALGSNTIINGLVFSMGAFTSTGTPTIYGSLITASTATATGNLKIVYDPNAIGKVSKIGRAAKVPGSFRDW